MGRGAYDVATWATIRAVAVAVAVAATAARGWRTLSEIRRLENRPQPEATRASTGNNRQEEWPPSAA